MRPVDHDPVGVPSAAPVLAGLGLLVAVAVGSWWLADAVVDGQTTAVVIRFAVTVAVAFYYLLLLRVATGRTIRHRWSGHGPR